VTKADDLGQEISFQIVVVNNGPSTVPLSQLNVVWPLFSPLRSDQFFLYPVEIDTVSGHILLHRNLVVKRMCLYFSEKQFGKSPYLLGAYTVINTSNTLCIHP